MDALNSKLDSTSVGTRPFSAGGNARTTIPLRIVASRSPLAGPQISAGSCRMRFSGWKKIGGDLLSPPTPYKRQLYGNLLGRYFFTGFFAGEAAFFATFLAGAFLAAGFLAALG